MDGSVKTSSWRSLSSPAIVKELQHYPRAVVDVYDPDPWALVRQIMPPLLFVGHLWDVVVCNSTPSRREILSELIDRTCEIRQSSISRPRMYDLLWPTFAPTLQELYEARKTIEYDFGELTDSTVVSVEGSIIISYICRR